MPDTTVLELFQNAEALGYADKPLVIHDECNPDEPVFEYRASLAWGHLVFDDDHSEFRSGQIILLLDICEYSTPSVPLASRWTPRELYKLATPNFMHSSILVRTARPGEGLYLPEFDDLTASAISTLQSAGISLHGPEDCSQLLIRVAEHADPQHDDDPNSPSVPIPFITLEVIHNV